MYLFDVFNTMLSNFLGYLKKNLNFFTVSQIYIPFKYIHQVYTLSKVYMAF